MKKIIALMQPYLFIMSTNIFPLYLGVTICVWAAMPQLTTRTKSCFQAWNSAASHFLQYILLSPHTHRHNMQYNHLINPPSVIFFLKIETF